MRLFRELLVVLCYALAFTLAELVILLLVWLGAYYRVF